MCCTAKKYEAARPELDVRGMRATDLVVTTREMVWMVKSAGIDFVNIKEEKPDSPLGLSSGAGAIFGVTGMEAAVRTAYELYTGETLIDIEMADIRGFQGVKEAKVVIDGKEIRLAVAHGLGNAHKVMEMVRQDRNRFHFVEVMGCPGGCIGGGRFRSMKRRSNSGPRRCTTWIGARRSGAATTTRTSRDSIASSWVGRSARKRTSCCIRTTRRSCREASFRPN